MTLPPGQHQLAVLARSAEASAISNEVEVDCRPAAEKPTLHVLAVGVNEYRDHDLNLKSAVNDARSVAQGLRPAQQGRVVWRGPHQPAA